MKVCVDLFCGLGGFSAAFEDAKDWHVVTVDIESRFDPDVQADVLELRPADILDALPVAEWDDMDLFVVLASPPCTQFSLAASSLERIVDGEPQTPEAREAVALAHHTIGLIQGMAPDYWWVENPRGYLRQFLGDPQTTVTYCQYGMDYMKPTDLWGEFPKSWHPRSCNHGDECHAYNTDGDHGGKGNCEVIADGAAERALVPYELSQSILDAVGAPDPQGTLADW
jgi:hypothetical protein